ncbi:hypothetical protein AUR64_04710 [Haloprofundus marisrubri]|uniref:Uncharacterized protein n=1 Tax=Haloprofundus marisrubri TaxID=1514971 RepID=A0A0W1RCT4_9EURY|nr:hypothetical protein [Haloprofundus marisrubri]KTG11231.1 hypothetical protein AUR64_04710 [Haloprofundus marisrubri]
MNRTLCRCHECNSVYAARKPDDGSVQIIGTESGCPCGSESSALSEMTGDSVDELGDRAS